jgi:hypothetical protein
MQSLPRAFYGLVRSNSAWTCSSCSRAARQSPRTPFFTSSMRTRTISNSSKPRQNVAPTMEQLRKPFQKKNNSTMYYTISIIMGTVALSYGSVPMYKMVRCDLLPSKSPLLMILRIDLPNHRLGRPTHQGPWTRRCRCRWRGPLNSPTTSHDRETHPRHIQRVGIRRAAVEVRAAAARGAGAPRRDGAGVLYSDE